MKQTFDTQMHINLSKYQKQLLDQYSDDLNVSSATIVRATIDSALNKLNQRKKDGNLNLLGI